MRKILNNQILVTVLSTFIPLRVTLAQVSENLIICGNTATDPCTFNHLIAVANEFIDVLIQLSLAISVVILLIIGAKYMLAGSGDAKAKAKESFVNLAKGFGFILGAWLIVNTIFIIAGVNETNILFER